jgi:protein TonB
MENQKHDQNSQQTVLGKSSKHDTNLQQNSTLYFQIGLILCLLSAYIALEYNFEQYSIVNQVATVENNLDETFVAKYYEIEKVVEVKEPNKVKSTILTEPKIVPDTTPDEIETKNIVKSLVTQIEQGKKAVQLDPNDLVITEIPLDIPLPLNKVEKVPVYPGCEKATNNNQRIKCMSDKLSKLIQSKFNTDIAVNEGLEGVQRIRVQFKILKNGEIQLVNLRAPHIALENEAARITSKIPNMKPGIQNGNAVDVIYDLPIFFDVQ